MKFDRNLRRLLLILVGKWNQDADTAISQIKRQGYMKVLQHYIGDVILVGINYDKRTKVHSCRIERTVKK